MWSFVLLHFPFFLLSIPFFFCRSATPFIPAEMPLYDRRYEGRFTGIKIPGWKGGKGRKTLAPRIRLTLQASRKSAGERVNYSDATHAASYKHSHLHIGWFYTGRRNVLCYSVIKLADIHLAVRSPLRGKARSILTTDGLRNPFVNEVSRIGVINYFNDRRNKIIRRSDKIQFFLRDKI